MRILGTCSLCGGAVGIPETWMGEVPPIPKCISCGATRKQPHGPMIDMEKPQKWSVPPGTSIQGEDIRSYYANRYIRY